VGAVNPNIGLKRLVSLTQKQNFVSQEDYIRIHTGGKISNYFNCLIEIKEILYSDNKIKVTESDYVSTVGPVIIASDWHKSQLQFFKNFLF
jgi:hypothetical protein